MVTSRKPVTLADIAARAGVSVGTASRVLNGTGQLSDSTRDAVLAAAEELDFKLAPRSRRQRTYTVGLITTDSFARFASPIMMGVEDALGDGRMSVLLADGRGDLIRERHHLKTFVDRRVDGIIMTGRRAEARASIAEFVGSIPTVYVLARSQEPEDLSVVLDDEQGARLAIDHLLSLGHRKIVHVTGPQKHLAARLRDEGARKALERTGLELSGETMWGEWSEAWGRQAAHLLVYSGVEFDAVFAGSDQIARGLVEELAVVGRIVPHDVSVVGFDNWDVMALATRPALTTIDPELADMGRMAANYLLQGIETGVMPTGVIPHPCKLVMRDSTGASAQVRRSDV